MLTAQFPYFGSKRHAAEMVWQALGDVASYAEPCCGSAAVLLNRPGGAGRIETINDVCGLVCNYWRAVKLQPEALAKWLDYPVSELDLTARHGWLNARVATLPGELEADPDFCDPKAAGWWAWGASCWIGSGWCDGKRHRQIPNLADSGKWSHRRQIPHLDNTGKGVARRTLDDGGPRDLMVWSMRLAERMRDVRVVCGDWQRVVTKAALSANLCNDRVGIFLDPPYEKGTTGLYSNERAGIASEVAAWALAANPKWRIVLAGYEGLDMPGWRCEEWYAEGFGTGGYNRTDTGRRERLYLSPSCLSIKPRARQEALF